MRTPYPFGARHFAFRLSLLAALALTGQGCVHLVQPQTYYLDTDRVRLQWEEYLQKELMAGLPETLFKRWYTRTDSWKDGLRPYILDESEQDGRTVYKVGSGGRTVARVYFKDGRLDEVGSWSLTQEAFLSAWLWSQQRPSEELGEGMLERLERLDPPSEVLIPEKHRDPGHVCEFEKGDVVESVSPLYLRDCETAKLCLTQRSGVPLNEQTEWVLPVGADLVIQRWGRFGGRAVAPGEPGKTYRVVTWQGDHGLCRRGECAHVGAEASLTRDLTVARGEWNRKEETIAVAAGQTRIPVWMERLAVLPAGTRVRVLEWHPCRGLIPGYDNAVIEIAGEPAGAFPPRLHVPFAPPGFFRPVTAEGGSTRARSLVE